MKTLSRNFLPPQQNQPRIAPASSLDADQARLLTHAPRTNGRPLAIFSTLAHHSKLLKRLSAMADVFQQGVLLPRDRELVVLRVAARCGSHYLFEEHSRAALQSGLSQDDLDHLRTHSTSPAWDDHRAALVAFTDMLLADGSVDDDTWDAVTFHEDAMSMIELIVLIGFYRMIAGFTNSVCLSLDDFQSAAP